MVDEGRRHFGIAPETVCRWRLKHADFREAYTLARRLRTEVWAEECIEIADDASGDYTIDKHGHPIVNTENVDRTRLRIDARKWQMARLDPQRWGNRQEIRVTDDWTQLSGEERVRRALQLIDLAKGAMEKKRLLEAGPPRIVYDPTDGDELADQ